MHTSEIVDVILVALLKFHRENQLIQMQNNTESNSPIFFSRHCLPGYNFFCYTWKSKKKKGQWLAGLEVDRQATATKMETITDC